MTDCLGCFYNPTQIIILVIASFLFGVILTLYFFKKLEDKYNKLEDTRNIIYEIGKETVLEESGK